MLIQEKKFRLKGFCSLVVIFNRFSVGERIHATLVSENSCYVVSTLPLVTNPFLTEML